MGCDVWKKRWEIVEDDVNFELKENVDLKPDEMEGPVMDVIVKH